MSSKNQPSRSPENQLKRTDQPKNSQTGNSSQQKPSTSSRNANQEDAELENKLSNRLGNFRQYLFVANCSLSYIAVGSSISWAAPLLYEVKKHGFEGKRFTLLEEIIIGSSIFVAMLVTPIPVGILCDRIGRKWALIIAGIVSCCSWLLLVFGNDVTMVYGSRVLGGFFAGSVMTIAPIYIGEIGRPKIRGSLHVINPVALLFGAEVTFVLGPNVQVREMAITCCVVPHIFLGLMFYFPESPHWLIHMKRYDQAQKNFEWFRGMKLTNNEELQTEWQQIVAYVEKDFPRHGHFQRLYSTKANKKALIIVQTLIALQRLAGITAITAFSAVTIPDQNIGYLRPSDVITVLGSVWIISTFITFLLIDNAGRVPLLIISCIGCFMMNVSCSSWYYVNMDNLDAPNTLAAHWFPFISITFYGVFFIIGIGSVPGVLQGEMFSPSNRAFASALTVMVGAAASGFVNVIYIPVASEFGYSVNFTFYALICLITLLFTLAVVPETKGKPLDVIQEMLAEDF